MSAAQGDARRRRDLHGAWPPARKRVRTKQDPGNNSVVLLHSLVHTLVADHFNPTHFKQPKRTSHLR